MNNDELFLLGLLVIGTFLIFSQKKESITSTKEVFITPSKNKTVTKVKLTPIPLPPSVIPPPPPVLASVPVKKKIDNIQEIANNSYTEFYIKGKGVKYFKFFATASSKYNYPIGLHLDYVPGHDSFGGDNDMIIKYAGENCKAGPPTVDDYYNIVKPYGKQYGNSSWDQRSKSWYPKRARNDLYYKLRRSDSNEFLEIYGDPDNPHGCYYVMIVNTGDKGQYLSLQLADIDSSYK